MWKEESSTIREKSLKGFIPKMTHFRLVTDLCFVQRSKQVQIKIAKEEAYG